MDKKSYLGKNKERFDGWMNIITGLNILGRDKKKSTEMKFECHAFEELEDIYALNDVAKKIVDVLPEDSMTKGHKITLGEDDQEKVNGFNDALDEVKKSLDLNEKVIMAMKYARLYGDAYLLMGVNDGQDPSEPIDRSKIRSIDYIQVFTRIDMQYYKIGTDPKSPFYRKPESFRLYSRHNNAFFNVNNEEYLDGSVHSSRLIHFSGHTLPHHLYWRNGYRNLSVLEKSLDKIMDYDTSHSSAATILQDATQGIFKIKDLAKLLGSGQDNLVAKRLQLVDLKRSALQSIVIDADGEDFSRDVPNLSGLPLLMEKMEKRMVASTDMPHTKVLGDGATGTLGGGGESENKEWYDTVARYQRDYLNQRLEDIYRLIFSAKSGPFRGQEPSVWRIEFNPLWEMSELQKADIRLKTSQADKNYIDSQVLSPDEVAMSRFGSSKFDMETALIFERNTDEDLDDDTKQTDNKNIKEDPDKDKEPKEKE